MPFVLDQMSIDNLSDCELVHRCLQGDRFSYVQLYRRYQPKVRSMLYQLCGAVDLDDLIQEVFLRVWKALPQFRHQSNFSTWLYRISWNIAAERRREMAQQRTQIQTLISTSARHYEAPDLMEMHYRSLVQRSLAQLSFEHRSVLVLHDLHDLPQKEVAAILGIPVGTVKSRLFHARAAVRQFLEKEKVQI